MKQKNNNLRFEKTVIDDSNNKSGIYKTQRDKLKMKLADKYNISLEESEKIVLEFEKRKNLNTQFKNTGSHNSDEKNNIDSISSKQVLTSDGGFDSVFNYEDEKSKKGGSQKYNYPEEGNVDNILEDIIPNYNQQISIKVDHVDLTFEVQNEKVDTLKETFIRTLNRKKSKKIKIHALKDISFEIYQGEKVGVIGYNGAGKSTLLNVITGIYPPDKGKVYRYGKISPLLSLGAGFDHNYSGRKNIMLNGAVLGYDKNFLKSKIDEIIEFSELGKFIDIPIKNYSSGMLAKLGFSIATSVNPDILIIDEILGVGDVNFMKKSSDKIKSLMDGGTTVILVSHSVPQIRELCDKAIWIDNGHVRAIGEVNNVCDAYLKDAEKASNQQLAKIELFKS